MDTSSAAIVRKKLLLVGWDAADWKIIDDLLAEGGMEGVRGLMDGGSHGNMATLEPQLSPMLWTSIASGKMAYHHGVEGFTEVDPVSGRVVPVSCATRKCKVLWEMLGEKGLRSHVVSWFATYGETEVEGKVVSDIFGHMGEVKKEQSPAGWPPSPHGSFWPPELGETLDELRVSPFEIDEEILHPFLPEAARIDQDRDQRLAPLRRHLAHAYSVHSAATHLMETEPEWDFMAVYYRAIDEISHDFMRYHPPRLGDVSGEDFRIYRHVVKATYRAHDMMLQRLIELAGPDTTVLLVSDHGFHSDHLRPPYTPDVPAGITVWHRNQGVFVAKGPDIAPARELLGARLLDIAPTVLHHFGLPVGKDMEGRVLTEIFRNDSHVETIPSWEGDIPRPARANPFSDGQSNALLEQFVALGYINAVSENPTQAAEDTLRENKWNLARAYLYAGKDAEALPLLEDCFFAFPERTDYSQTLARTQFKLGLVVEAVETLDVCLEYLGDSPGAEALRGQKDVAMGNFREAIARLEKAAARYPDHVLIAETLCTAYQGTMNREGARRRAEKLLGLDPTSITAHVILAGCLVLEGEAEAASEMALKAIFLQFANPTAHLVLGQAMVLMGVHEEAGKAFENALRLAPGNPAILSDLKKLHRLMGRDREAEECDATLVRNRLRVAVEKDSGVAKLRTGAAARASGRLMERARKRIPVPEVESAASGTEFVIVSGLPRSGTSLMMQMLAAAGLEPLTDGLRKPDEDNPEGYLEWEAVRSLPESPSLICQALGKAVKVVSPLLGALSPMYRYKILFMRRPVSEIVDSQTAMISRKGGKPSTGRAELIAAQEKHLEEILKYLAGRPEIELLEVDFPGLIEDASKIVPGIELFLGTHLMFPRSLEIPLKPEYYRKRERGQA